MARSTERMRSQLAEAKKLIAALSRRADKRAANGLSGRERNTMSLERHPPMVGITADSYISLNQRAVKILGVKPGDGVAVAYDTRAGTLSVFADSAGMRLYQQPGGERSYRFCAHAFLGFHGLRRVIGARWVARSRAGKLYVKPASQPTIVGSAAVAGQALHRALAEERAP